MNTTNENTTPDDAVRQELTRILASPIFAQSDRLARFLRFTVEHAISGNEQGLKEYVIGTEVYDRKRRIIQVMTRSSALKPGDCGQS